MGGLFNLQPLSTAQDTSIKQLDRLAITNPATLHSIDDLLAWIADVAVTANSPGGLGPVAGSIVDKLKLLASGGAGDLTIARVAALDGILGTGGLRGGITGPTVVYPQRAGAAGVLSGGGAWTLGNYVDVIAANNLAAHALIAVLVDEVANDLNNFEIEIATGAAGAEVVAHRCHSRNGSVANAGGGTQIIPVVPSVNIPANARVAMRNAADVASKSCNVWCIFAPRPY